MFKKRFVFALLIISISLISGCWYVASANSNTGYVMKKSAKKISNSKAKPSTGIWCLKINDTVKEKVHDYKVVCHLKVDAVKSNGSNELGIYKGNVSLTYSMYLEKGAIQGAAKGNGSDKHAQFKVERFNTEKYSHNTPGNLGDYNPMVHYSGMAIGSLSLKGTGNVKEKSHQAAWTKNDKKTKTYKYRMLIVNKHAEIVIDNLFAGESMRFEGIIVKK